MASSQHVSLVGTVVPAVKVALWENGPKVINSRDFFKNKRIVVFTIPGAYTPTCQQKHVPSYVNNCQKFKV